jgi:hypothetical protein
MKNTKLFFGILICSFFITCNFDNPIMEKWWEEDPFYVPIIKTLPPEEI